MGVFDQIARRVAKRDGAGFFRWALVGLDPALSFIGWSDARTVPESGKKELTLDAVGEFANAARPEEPWLFVVEFKAVPRADDLEQLLEYVVRCRRERRLQSDPRLRYSVGGALVDLTGRRPTGTLSMSVPGMPGFGLSFGPIPRPLSGENASATLTGIGGGQIAPCILPLVPLMAGAAEAAVVAEWKRMVDSYLPAHDRDEYAADARILAGLARVRPAWDSTLKEYKMETSDVVMEWQAEAKVETQRAVILRALERLCKAPVPADVAQAVRATTDLATLSRWFDAALDAATYDDFRAAIKS
jgi:hypothetical protein